MEKRFFLALFLTGIVLVVTPMLFRPTPPAGGPGTQPTLSGTSTKATEPRPTGPVVELPARTMPSGGRPPNAPGRAVPETLQFATGKSNLSVSTLGASPIAVTLHDHRTLTGKAGALVIHDGSEPLLQFRVVTGADTIRLDTMVFRAARRSDHGKRQTAFIAADPTTLANIVYETTDTAYLSRVRVELPLSQDRTYLLVKLPSGFTSQEADTTDDIRHLGFAGKPVGRGAEGISFASLDPGEQKLIAGPMSWVVAKSKYFLVGLLSPGDSTPFAELQAVGGVRASKLATRANGTVVIPVLNGRAEFALFAGPQAWENMRALGREFETANPYGGFMQPIVQPFSTIVMRMMLWLKRVVRLDYGWVLVIFGVAIRIVLWPLNQSAMRASLRLQRIQPELMAVQERYKNDRTRQQQEILRVYQEHGMSPFSALSGCLPALIPMPVFFALFFVFQNTIEFRGVPFLWLHDISLRDPLYILPIVTGASMFVLSWIGMRNMPRNPQATMMLYLMPGMFTVFLLSTASGLSIYYLVQQLAAIPQQWMIATERRKAGAKA